MGPSSHPLLSNAQSHLGGLGGGQSSVSLLADLTASTADIGLTPKHGSVKGHTLPSKKLKCAASIKQSLEEEARSGPGRRGSLFKCKKTLKHANLGGRREVFSAGGSPWGLKAPLRPFPGTGQTPRCCHVGPSRAGGASALPRGRPPRPRPTGGVHSLTRW